MSDISGPSRPLLHPVLTLHKEPVLRTPPGGGKEEKDIVKRRLAAQRKRLAQDFAGLRQQKSRDALNVFGGYTLLLAEMFAGSTATTWTPRNLFSLRGKSLTRAAAGNGYIVEIDGDDFPLVERRVVQNESIASRCDISRVKTIRPWAEDDIYRGRSARKIWDEAIQYDGGRGFIIWLAPFRDPEARNDVLLTLNSMRDEELFLPTSPRLLLGTSEGADITLPDLAERQDSLGIVKRNYRAYGHGRALIEVPSTVALHQIISSGAVFRIEPARPIYMTAPGEGAEPSELPRSHTYRARRWHNRWWLYCSALRGC